MLAYIKATVIPDELHDVPHKTMITKPDVLILAEEVYRRKRIESDVYFSLSATFGSFLALTGWATTIEH
jgi:hypothetical protein